jgi:hypothetical protein
MNLGATLSVALALSLFSPPALAADGFPDIRVIPSIPAESAETRQPDWCPRQCYFSTHTAIGDEAKINTAPETGPPTNGGQFPPGYELPIEYPGPPAPSGICTFQSKYYSFEFCGNALKPPDDPCYYRIKRYLHRHRLWGFSGITHPAKCIPEAFAPFPHWQRAELKLNAGSKLCIPDVSQPKCRTLFVSHLFTDNLSSLALDAPPYLKLDTDARGSVYVVGDIPDSPSSAVVWIKLRGTNAHGSAEFPITLMIEP